MEDIERQKAKSPIDAKEVEDDFHSAKTIAVGQENLYGVTPPHESFEGYHRFDPTASWTVKEERMVVMKTDILLLAWICLMVIYCLLAGYRNPY
jgi:hypothetical protein